MNKRPKLKEIYEIEAKCSAFYTGGNIEWHEEWLYCQNASHISKVCFASGIVSQEVGREQDGYEPDAILTFTTNGNKLITAHASGLLKLWNTAGELAKQWRSIHKGPIECLRLIDDVLLTGGTDGIVRVWDVHHQVCVKALRGCTGVIDVLEVNADLIYASGDDGNIISWHNDAVKTAYNGHFAKVTSLGFTRDGRYMISGGRDKVLILWKLGNGKPVKTLPLYQTVECLLVLDRNEKYPNGVVPNAHCVLVAGDTGALSIWDLDNVKEIYKQQGSLGITHLLRSGANIAVVSSEHNIIVHDLHTFAITKQYIGYSDEILDIALCGEGDRCLAVATNSKDIKLYENATMSCQLLQGHTDIVMALNRAPFNTNLLVSCSKDNTIRLWCIDNAPRCVALGMRHTAVVNSVCFFHTAKGLVSGSQDNCLKLWNIGLATTMPKQVVDLHADVTQVAHSKDINSIAISPNDALIASCSQDKRIKLWTDKLGLLGVLKGHKRSVWCCRFSPVDQVLLSASTDATIKLWSITGLNCLKTIIGHEASVLQAEFLSQGMQILSCGADGFVKLFDIKTSECKLTLDAHEGNVWCLAVTADESMFITGGSDSTLIKWKDVTEQKKLEKQLEEEQIAAEEQKLSNYLKQEKSLKALRLALKLSKPLTVLRIIEGVIKKKENLRETVSDLKAFEKDALLQCACEWNTNSRSSHAAQFVFNILMLEMQAGRYQPANSRALIEDNLGYTERHYRRITDLMQDFKFIDYTINCMQPFNNN